MPPLEAAVVLVGAAAAAVSVGAAAAVVSVGTAAAAVVLVGAATGVAVGEPVSQAANSIETITRSANKVKCLLFTSFLLMKWEIFH